MAQSDDLQSPRGSDMAEAFYQGYSATFQEEYERHTAPDLIQIGLHLKELFSQIEDLEVRALLIVCRRPIRLRREDLTVSLLVSFDKVNFHLHLDGLEDLATWAPTQARMEMGQVKMWIRLMVKDKYFLAEAFGQAVGIHHSIYPLPLYP